MTNPRLSKTCKESRAIQTHRVFPTDLNQHQTLFGGKLMSMVDDTASISVARHCRAQCVTASTDSLDFIHPISADHSICITSYISGVGTSSVEVFCKIIGEDLMSGERYLAGTAFMTFVAFQPNGAKIIVPLVIAETEEEKWICAGYEERRQKRLAHKKFNAAFSQQVTLEVPWLSEYE